MKASDLNKLSKKYSPEKIAEKYMLSEIFLTQSQLEKLLNMKAKDRIGRGGVNFKYAKKEVNKK